MHTNHTGGIVSHKFNAVLLVALAPAVLCGCTAGTVYRTMQAAAWQACMRQPPSEQERCEARINKDDFETYERNRSRN